MRISRQKQANILFSELTSLWIAGTKNQPKEDVSGPDIPQTCGGRLGRRPRSKIVVRPSEAWYFGEPFVLVVFFPCCTGTLSQCDTNVCDEASFGRLGFARIVVVVEGQMSSLFVKFTMKLGRKRQTDMWYYLRHGPSGEVKFVVVMLNLRGVCLLQSQKTTGRYGGRHIQVLAEWSCLTATISQLPCVWWEVQYRGRRRCGPEQPQTHESGVRLAFLELFTLVFQVLGSLAEENRGFFVGFLACGLKEQG